MRSCERAQSIARKSVYNRRRSEGGIKGWKKINKEGKELVSVLYQSNEDNRCWCRGSTDTPLQHTRCCSLFLSFDLSVFFFYSSLFSSLRRFYLFPFSSLSSFIILFPLMVEAQDGTLWVLRNKAYPIVWYCTYIWLARDWPVPRNLSHTWSMRLASFFFSLAHLFLSLPSDDISLPREWKRAYANHDAIKRLKCDADQGNSIFTIQWDLIAHPIYWHTRFDYAFKRIEF